MFPRAAVITGGARGLGRAFAEALLERGIKVVIGDVNASLGHETIQAFHKKFPNTPSMFLKCDVTQLEDLKGLMDSASAHMGPIELFVNNAGIASEKHWDKMVDINLKGVIGGTFVASEKMSRANGGNGGLVINMGSTAGIVPMFFSPSYSAVKFGVIGLTRSMAAGYQAEQDVRYNCLCPSFTNTDMVKSMDILGDPVDAGSNVAQTSIMEVPAVVEAFLKIVDSSDMNGAVVAISPRGLKVKYDIGAHSKL